MKDVKSSSSKVKDGLRKIPTCFPYQCVPLSFIPLLLVLKRERNMKKSEKENPNEEGGRKKKITLRHKEHFVKGVF